MDVIMKSDTMHTEESLGPVGHQCRHRRGWGGGRGGVGRAFSDATELRREGQGQRRGRMPASVSVHFPLAVRKRECSGTLPPAAPTSTQVPRLPTGIEKSYYKKKLAPQTQAATTPGLLPLTHPYTALLIATASSYCAGFRVRLRAEPRDSHPHQCSVQGLHAP